jgi:hypothetical protein
MIAELLRSLAMNMEYAHRLLADVGESQMTAQPVVGMNHAAWIAGHLAYSFQMIGGELGLKPWLPSRWAELFGTGSDPQTVTDDYPKREDLFAALEEGQRRLSEALTAMSDTDLNRALPDER